MSPKPVFGFDSASMGLFEEKTLEHYYFFFFFFSSMMMIIINQF